MLKFVAILSGASASPGTITRSGNPAGNSGCRSDKADNGDPGSKMATPASKVDIKTARSN